MPFQAIPIAMRKTTGSPLSKLVLIFVTRLCEIKPITEYKAPLAYAEPETLARLCQCSVEDLKRALLHLETIGEIRLPVPDPNGGPDWCFIEVLLPMSSTPAKDRRRIKCGPDQVAALQDRDGLLGVCALCGEPPEDENNPRWDVDHIIPRSVGGADVEENCQGVCDRCNSRKGAKLHFLDFLR